jgi:hypothetical protein
MSSSYVEPPVRPLRREQLSFLAVINFLLRNLGLMLILGVVMSAALVIRVVREPLLYSSTSIFSIGDFGGGARITAMLGGGYSFSSAGATYITEIMTQPAFLEPLATREFEFPEGKTTAMKYYGGPGRTPDQALEAAMGNLAAAIHTDISTTTGWISLTTKAKTPKLAEQMNYVVLAQLDSMQADRRRKQSTEDQKFAQDRLAELGARLNAAQQKLRIFQETNINPSSPGLRIEENRLRDSVANAQSLYSTILGSYERERIDAERQTRLLTLIAKPSVPHSPDKRPYARTVVLGLFGGLFIGAMLALILEYFRRIQTSAAPEEAAEFDRLRAKWFGWILRPFRSRLASR